jgi:ATP adenylyltransferase
MVVPFRHIRNLEELESKEYNEIFSFVQLSVSVLKKSFKADGFNVGFNLGETAGAGIAQHLHMHVVPRWNGDHNLMSVISETRVLPESLETTYSTLSVYFSG